MACTPSDAMSSGYCWAVAPMTPCFTRLTPGPAAVDRDDEHTRLASSLKRLVRAVGGRLIDRVHEVNVRVLRKEDFHPLLAAIFGALRGLVPDDRVWALAVGAAGRFGRVRTLLDVADGDAH